MGLWTDGPMNRLMDRPTDDNTVLLTQKSTLRSNKTLCFEISISLKGNGSLKAV